MPTISAFIVVFLFDLLLNWRLFSTLQKMSMSSYRRNVARGVTGIKTDTCYLASLEKISPYNQLSPETYIAYQRFMGSYFTYEGQEKRKVNPQYKELIRQMAWELGEVEFDQVAFERADTYRAFSSTVRSLLRHEYRVSVDIQIEGYGDRTAHPVGLIPVDDEGRFKVVSTWTPQLLRGVVTLRDIYDTIDFCVDPPSVRYPFNDANITALPPAA